jgi:hypothetical protein
VKPRLPATLAAIAALCLLYGASLVAADVLLLTSWIEEHKNRVTVTASMTIDKTHNHPNSVGQGSDDGDLHFAGRAEAIGLPMVAEIVNARLPDGDAGVDAVKAAQQSGDPVELGGVWRLWFEHPSAEAQTQGETVPVPEHTNPDHVFEIHPLLSVGDLDLGTTLVPIPEYVPHEAGKAFKHYESRVFTVTVGSPFTSINAKKALYNYAEFVIELTGDPEQTADQGWMALATIEDDDGESLAGSARRMVFAPGTRPAEIISQASGGDRFRVLGVPRVNLERLMAAGSQQPGVPVSVKGAYEMIVMGVFEEDD